MSAPAGCSSLIRRSWFQLTVPTIPSVPAPAGVQGNPRKILVMAARWRIDPRYVEA
jgi:hypothetical protein